MSILKVKYKKIFDTLQHIVRNRDLNNQNNV